MTEQIKRGRGRPRLHPDRKVYKAQHERERRARLKLDRSKAKEDKQNG